MSRERDTDHPHAYRLVVTGKFRPTYHGPYATIGAAKAKRTRLRNEAERYKQLPNDYRIERTSGTWEEVEA